MLWSLLLSFNAVLADPASHRVTSLPKAPAFGNYSMYSGYLPIPNSNGKELHYVFYTSQGAPGDPVVLWLNGGPGCSSMEGAFMENGPLVFSETNNTMYVNPYSWNMAAHMLYIEAPAGVGYSMMGSILNNATNDNQTASDNLQALLYWFQLFPEYQSHAFYISGESYAGVYVPSLAYFILQNNIENPSQEINLQGFLVGNPVTDWNVDADSAWPSFLYWHELIDDSIYMPWVNLNCSLLWNNAYDYCNVLASQMYSLFTQVNYYDIYRECIPASNLLHQRRWLSENLGGISNCVPNNALTRWMNIPSVRNALHINNTLGAWQECSDLDYDSDMVRGSIYLYPDLIGSGLRIGVYSGDTDSCVPTEGTMAWINNLNLTPAVNWTAWDLNGQVGGFYVRYQEGLRFNTIRGSGHMCIQWNRPAGYQMFTYFIDAKDLA